MGKYKQKFFRESAKILEDVQTGDIVTITSSVASVITVAGIYFLATRNTVLAILLLCLVPFAIIYLTIFYKWILSWSIREMKRLGGDSEEKQTKQEVIVPDGGQLAAKPQEAKLTLKDFGFEIKGWADDTYTVNAYIDISSPNVIVKNAYPTITWTNEQGVRVDENNGRWFISNEDRIRTTTDALLSIDLESNGKPRRLHFTTNNKERKLFSWWRSPDDHNKSKTIPDSPVYIVIFLKASNGPMARFRFRIAHSADVLRLERLNNKRQVIDIDNVREFRYAELFPDEKKEDSRAKKEKSEYSSATVKRFSSNLEKIKKERIKKGWQITGVGLGFLDKIKTAPPFLGLEYKNPIISAVDEKELTEFFLASIYMEEYGNDVKGGRYIVKDGDDHNSIAMKVYGRESHSYYLPQHVITGMILDLPYLNLARPDHPDDVERMKNKSRDIETVETLLEKYNIVRRESIPLLRIVYDAAQKTLNERNK